MSEDLSHYEKEMIKLERERLKLEKMKVKEVRKIRSSLSHYTKMKAVGGVLKDLGVDKDDVVNFVKSAANKVKEFKEDYETGSKSTGDAIKDALSDAISEALEKESDIDISLELEDEEEEL